MKEAYKSDLIMATWNIQIMLTTGKMQEISNERIKDGGRKILHRKKKRKTTSEMYGQCVSRLESNEDKAVDGEERI
jgi:hypothetical protein